MANVHLFWMTEEHDEACCRTLSGDVIQNLGLSTLCDHIAKNQTEQKILLEHLVDFCSDEATIQYRQDVFRDIAADPHATAVFQEILAQLQLLQIQTCSNVSEEARLWFFFSRFRELETYAACIRRIHELFQEVTLSSAAFCALRGQIAELIQSDIFTALEAFVKGFRLDVDQVKSITVGINLDASLNPESVALVSVNSQKYKSQTFISSVSNVFEKKEFQDLLLPAKLHQMSQDRQDHLLYVVYQDVERYLKPLVRTLSDSLNRFTSICTNTLTYLIPELLFYVRFAEFYHEIRAFSMPVCFPSIREKALRETDIEGVYHLNLMLHMLERGQAPQQEMVPNDFCLDEQGRILLITGPNRGGKTIYTLAVGVSYLLFQAGLFVPATTAAMSPIDCLYTHFPADENMTIGEGRLGEESKRLHRIFLDATRHSLILMNESLTSTNHTEAVYIAKGVVKAFRRLGAAVIFNTHMYELAQDADHMNTETLGTSRIITLNAELHQGERSYRIRPGVARGNSYADDVAKKYGVDYETLVKVVEGKR